MRFLLALFIIGLLYPAERANAQVQWKIVAPNVVGAYRLIPGVPVEFGAVAAKDEVVLAGWTNLVLSLDGGITWTDLPAVSANDYIMDIAIYDDHTFAMITGRRGVFLSSDQGATWRNVENHSDGWSLTFDGSPTRLAATYLGTTGYEIDAYALTKTPFTL